MWIMYAIYVLQGRPFFRLFIFSYQILNNHTLLNVSLYFLNDLSASKISKQDREKIKKDNDKAYISKLGLEKSIRAACSLQCRLGCNIKITEKQHKELFDYYYSLGNITKQWQFLAKQLVQEA